MRSMRSALSRPPPTSTPSCPTRSPPACASVNAPDMAYVRLDEMLGRSDVVVCLAVAHDKTENLIGQAALARMAPHAFFVNLSRGNLVDEGALTAALRENRIAGDAMDVG